jgi:PAS domain S-box-containing protein
MRRGAGARLSNPPPGCRVRRFLDCGPAVSHDLATRMDASRPPPVSGPHARSRIYRLGTWAWLPVPVLLAAILVARAAGLQEVYEADALRLALSVTFYTLVSVGTLFLVGRSFLASGAPGLLLLECGVILWSLAGTTGDAFDRGDSNVNVSIFNLAILLAGLCHLAGVILVLRPQRPLRARGPWLAAGSALAVGTLWLVTLAALDHWLPLFFVPGQGGTAVRYTVLTTAIFTFVLSAVLLYAGQRGARRPFASWYAPALLLLAVGLFGVMIQLSLGSAVNWLGRTAQWLGGAYLLVASVAATRESHLPLIPPPRESTSPLYGNGVAVAVVLAAAAVRMALLQSLGTHAPFVLFFPAVMLAALYGGWRAGLLAIALSVALVDLYWLEPSGQPGIGRPADWVAMVAFVASGALLCLVTEGTRRAQARARGAEAEARVVAARQRDQEALERSNRTLAEVLDSIQDDFYVLDRNWVFTFASKRFAARIGRVPEDFLGKSIWELFPKHLGTAYEENLRAAMDRREVRRFEIGGRYTDAWYRMSVSPSAEGISVLGTEITESRRMQEELRDANLRLVEADQRKNEFLGMLSHELRNPLTPIRNSLFILDRATPGSEQARRAREVIERQTSHLTRLVDDLLDVTRITRGKFRLQRARLNLVDVVRRTVEDHRSLLEGRALAVELPAEAIWVDGDSTRLGQVVGNLLTNAAKFTPEAGRVSVRVERRGDHAVVEVTDTGLGIDGETFRRLFEPFAQADRSLDRSRGGLGLGLALVKGMVDLHGGRVGAHSDGPGRGSRFLIELPLDPQELARPQPSSAPARATARGRSVLVVEDNRDAADSLAEVLGLAGHQVEVAYAGPEGIAKALEHRPEVVLCDIGLPGTDGYAVARAIRRDRGTAPPYLVALTGYAQSEDQQKAREAGFDAHLAKPPDLAALERLLAEAPVRTA